MLFSRHNHIVFTLELSAEAHYAPKPMVIAERFVAINKSIAA
jgi:hypothetical protein